MFQKIDLQFSVSEVLTFSLMKFDISLIFEISDEIFSLTDISVSREFSFYFTFS